MIKNPITKTGEVRYFEILKISLLLSFLYAFSSTLSDKEYSIVSQSSTYLMFILFGVLSVILSIIVVYETLSLVKLLKSLVVIFITFKLVIFFNDIKKGIHTLYEYPLVNKIHLRLCVIQC